MDSSFGESERPSRQEEKKNMHNLSLAFFFLSILSSFVSFCYVTYSIQHEHRKERRASLILIGIIGTKKWNECRWELFSFFYFAILTDSSREISLILIVNSDFNGSFQVSHLFHNLSLIQIPFSSIHDIAWKIYTKYTSIPPKLLFHVTDGKSSPHRTKATRRLNPSLWWSYTASSYCFPVELWKIHESLQMENPSRLLCYCVRKIAEHKAIDSIQHSTILPKQQLMKFLLWFPLPSLPHHFKLHFNLINLSILSLVLFNSLWTSFELK